MRLRSFTRPPSASILLVEDEPVVSAFLECALQHLGLEVTACGDVRSALESLRRHLPTLILTDYNLPIQSGIDLIRVVVSQGKAMPIIGMSAQHDKGEEMIASGALAFLPKPIEIDTLNRIVVQIAKCAVAHGNIRR